MTVKVLHLGSPNGLYGAERWILALVKHLDPARVESHVGVILDEPGAGAPLLAQAAVLGATTMAVEAHGRFNPRAVSGLRAYLLQHRIDVLHTHFYKTDLVGLLAARGTGCRLVTTPHGWSTRAGLALSLYESLDRLAFRHFDAVVPLSPELHRELQGRAGPGLTYIRNGVDVDEVDAAASGTVRPARSEGRVIGYVGQLIARKGLDVLLRAFAQLPDATLRLRLVGEGPQRAQLESLARDLGIGSRTEFLGYRTDRIALMRDMDVFVLPSLLEGIPRCLMEAMAAGVPVVASDIPGCRDLVEHGRTGLLAAAGSVAGLAAALGQVLQDDCDAMIRAARQHVVANFSAASMAERYTGLYLKLQARALEDRGA